MLLTLASVTCIADYIIITNTHFAITADEVLKAIDLLYANPHAKS